MARRSPAALERHSTTANLAGPAGMPRHASRQILGLRVDATSYPDAVERILGWAARSEPRYVCVSTVHMVMEAHDDRSFQALVNRADLITPDGMPLVWALRLLGVAGATRVYGPDLTPRLCIAAAERGIPVGFYGGTAPVLERMADALERDIPGLRVVYRRSPPFRALTEAERAAEIEEINRSGARLLFVGLGCPKQERWMAARQGQVRPVMIGVGAAFDFLAGTKPKAPGWMQRAGLEWLFRLASEPRRLWRRYLYNNPRFLVLFGRQLIGTYRQGANR